MAIEVKLKDAPRAWNLDTPQAMQEAQIELVESGYRSTLQVWPEFVDGDSSGPRWQLEANDSRNDTQHSVIAVLGDYLLLSGGLLQRLTASQWSEVAK